MKTRDEVLQGTIDFVIDEVIKDTGYGSEDQRKALSDQLKNSFNAIDLEEIQIGELVDQMQTEAAIFSDGWNAAERSRNTPAPLIDKLEEKRAALGLSERGFALFLGINPSMWSRFRFGRRRLGHRTITKLIKAFPDLHNACFQYFSLEAPVGIDNPDLGRWIKES